MEFDRCQFCYYQKYVLETPDPTEDTDALLIGSAFDDLLTYGIEKFNTRYQVVKMRTAKAEAEASANGIILLNNGLYNTIMQMYKEFKLNPLFEQNPKKKLIQVELKGLRLSGELDDYSPGLIRDHKTAASVVGLEDSRNEYFKRYLFQMAFYAFLVEAQEDAKCDAILQITDKHANWSRSMAIRFSHSTLQAEFGRIMQLIDELKEATESKLFLPANSQRVLWDCHYYGVPEISGKRHGCPTEPMYY